MNFVVNSFKDFLGFRDIKAYHPQINKNLTMAHSAGSIELQLGYYVEKEDIDALR
ncbi:MAG: hypothetical protein FWE23_04260 [Chitinivibrionia bacterium]|nr:hypothetical protein [Chitinivibrionia bacterium]